MEIKGRAVDGDRRFAVAGWFSRSAQAAQSDGVAFPCTKAFGEQVVIASHFDQFAAQFNPNFSDPEFWGAAQVLCLDFDQDGNDEMAILLGAMGGNAPWAFFDVPQGDPAQATFSFPIEEGGRYPNHGIEAYLPPGSPPLIKETRALYHRSDAHCCPTGGKRIRIIGFVNGSYQVLSTIFHRKHRKHHHHHRSRRIHCRDVGPAQTDVALYKIVARRIKCGTARAILRRWYHDPSQPDSGPAGWNCAVIQRGQFQVRHYCRRNGRRIAFSQFLA